MRTSSTIVATPEDAKRMLEEVSRRMRIVGAVEITLSDPDSGEYARWMRRYHQLAKLLADSATVGGRRYRMDVWDLMLKEMFLLPEEVELPNGKVIVQRPSKTRLSREEREKFLQDSKEYAAREHGVALINPEEDAYGG
jgi:hypothetical protein